MFWLLITMLIIIALSVILVPLANQNIILANKQKTIFAFILILFPVMALVFYNWWGSSSALSAYFKTQQQLAATEELKQKLNTPEQVIMALRQRLAEDPTSAKGWYLLGKLYLSTNQLTDAAKAFGAAQKLDPNNTEVLFQYAQALYLIQHNLSGEPSLLLKRILELDPHHGLAINLLAVAAYEQGQYQQAIRYWETLLATVPPGSPDSEALLKVIAKAQAELSKRK